MIVVCWKWVAPDDDARWGGVSHADQTALEAALRLAEAGARGGSGHTEPVHVVSLGPAAADAGLRAALAAGAAGAVRIDASTALVSAATAAALAGVIEDLAGRGDELTWVLCGDYSADRGSGSTPAFIAAEIDIAQALGLVSIEAVVSGDAAGRLRAVRRLDGGRREVLEISAPAVVSIEGSAMRLRRSSPAAELAAQRAHISVVPGPTGPVDSPHEIGPYRPRPRVLAAPAGTTTLDRVRSITGSEQGSHHASETVVLEPAAAAQRLLAALRDRGYLDQVPAGPPDANARHNER